MSDNAIGVTVLVCIFSASLLGMALRGVLADHHLSSDTKDSVKLGMGLVGTMAALILGLLVAAAKGSYDAEKNEVTQMAAKIVFLDRVLANYGPESADSRVLLRRMVEGALNRMWPDERSQHVQLDPAGSGIEELHKSIQKLTPKNDAQASLRAQAVGMDSDLGQLRWLLFEQSGRSVSMPLLIVVISWLAIIFLSWGLFAPANSIAITALLLAAISVSGAIFVILELDQPFEGVIQIPSAPMRNALAHLGK
jgi:disulfide bond formation protein DsbB